MKLLTFNINGKITQGALRDGCIVDIGARLGSCYPDLKVVLAANALPELYTLIESVTADYATVDLEFLSIIGNPARIFCIGLSYESHREETGCDRPAYPVVFAHFADTQVGHRQPLDVPQVSTSLDYEGELAVVIGHG